jgi:perosamine synthetase
MSFKELPLMSEKKGITLFYPYVSKLSIKKINKTLNTRWIGQGPLVDKFEKKFSQMFLYNKECVSVGSGTDALHLAYLLAGLKKGDEVIAPVFTCTATNIPLLYIGVKIKFADVNPSTMNIDIDSVKKLITKNTKAIICVHYGGIPCEMDALLEISKKYNLKIIEDAAQGLGATYNNKNIGTIGDYGAYSFQAIKHITTGDGGLLSIKKNDYVQKAKRLRWFGIDRNKKQQGVWKNDIKEIGYKYQMTDLGASIGYCGLLDFEKILKHRRKIYNIYLNELKKNKKIKIIHDYDKKKKTAAWIFTIALKERVFLQKELRKKNIETNQVHFRNDKYSIFKKFCFKRKFPNMDYLENKYLVLPVHTNMTENDAHYICEQIKKIIN